MASPQVASHSGQVRKCVSVAAAMGRMLGASQLLQWRAVPAFPVLLHHIGPAGLALIAAGGLLYTLGALGYHRRWPNPAPDVFGFHEVFHTFVCAAVACHCLAIAIFVL